jgi:hypothetical protein
MRHYPKMPKKPGSDDCKAKPKYEKADEKVLYYIAWRLDFNSPQIKELMEQSPDHQIARAVLLRARKPDRYQYDSSIFGSLVDCVVGCFAQADPLEDQVHYEVTVSRETDLKRRCGLPLTKAQEQDCRFLLIDQLHADERWTDDKISTRFVRQCVYFAFFGKLLGSPPCSPARAESYHSEHDFYDSLFIPDASTSPEPHPPEESTSLDRRTHEHQMLQQEAQQRLELERLEQGRLEQERFEQERLEQERLEQERLEQQQREQSATRPVTQIDFTEFVIPATAEPTQEVSSRPEQQELTQNSRETGAGELAQQEAEYVAAESSNGMSARPSEKAKEKATREQGRESAGKQFRRRKVSRPLGIKAARKRKKQSKGLPT